MYNGMFVQIHFIAEHNCLHYTLGNSAPLTVVVLIAWVEKLSCHGSDAEKNLYKARFKNQNDDLNTENRRTCEIGNCCSSFS